MKKSSFVALLFGMAGGVLFALGMCMVLLSEWDMFRPGIGFGCVGILLGGVAVVVWRKMEKKSPIHLSGKTVFAVAIAVTGVLALGVGMCFSMVWDQLVIGTAIGLVGIGILVCLIPLVKGIKD